MAIKRRLTAKQKLAGFGGKRAQAGERGARHKRASVSRGRSRSASLTRRHVARRTATKGVNPLLAGGLGAAAGVGAAGLALGIANHFWPGNGLVQTIDHALGVQPSQDSQLLAPGEGQAIAEVMAGTSALAAGSRTMNPLLAPVTVTPDQQAFYDRLAAAGDPYNSLANQAANDAATLGL